MQQDFWTFHSNPLKRKRFLFLWDERYDIVRRFDRLENCIRAMRPSVVVFGSAVWFVWNGLRDFRGYKAALKDVLAKLGALATRLVSLSVCLRMGSRVVFEK